MRGFAADGTFMFEYIEEVRKSDGVALDRLSADERNVLADEVDWSTVVAGRVTWHPGRAEDTTLV